MMVRLGLGLGFLMWCHIFDILGTIYGPDRTRQDDVVEAHGYGFECQ